MIFLVLRQAQDEENHIVSILTLSLSEGEDAVRMVVRLFIEGVTDQ